MRERVTFILIAIAALWLLPGVAQAQFFPPGPADDVTVSLGQAVIWVHPTFRPLVQPLPGWNPMTNRWTTPVMGDRNTVIGRSAVHPDGGSRDVGGTAVGTAGTWISDGSFTVVPTSGFNEGPPGTREVHTEIWKLDMQDPAGCIRLRAGTGAGVSPISPGEVEALGVPDFPAESFFNVFIELDAPFGTLCNPPDRPLVVVSTGLMSLPPVVIYTHGNTNAVPVYLGGGGNCPANDPPFGYLLLAGHGTYPPSVQCGSFDCTGVPIDCPQAAALSAAVHSGEPMHCPECGVVSQPTEPQKETEPQQQLN